MISFLHHIQNIVAIYQKEIRETLRDKRTLFLTLFLPVLLYPLLMLGMSQAVVLQLGNLEKKKSKIGFCGEYPLLKEILIKDERFEIISVKKEEISDWIRTEKIELALEVPESFLATMQSEESNPLPKVSVYYIRTKEKSQLTVKKITALLERIHFQEMQTRLEKIQKPTSFVMPFQISLKNISKAEEEGGFEFGKVLSLLLVLMAVSFTLHPAIDMGAGEKERGTMETLLISSARRYEIVLGKYLAVFTIGMAGSILNLASMGLTFEQFAGIASRQEVSMPAQTQKNLEKPVQDLQKTIVYESDETSDQKGSSISFSISFSTIFMIMAILVPMLGLFSAISLALSVFARTYKEAQYYLTPLMVIVMPLAMVSIIPAMKLDMTKSLIPIVGVVLLYKELFMGQIPWIYITTVFLSTLLYAGLALLWAVKLFEKEEVFCREGDSLKMEFWNVKEKRQTVLTFSQGMILFLLVMVLYYFIGKYFAGWNFLKGQIFTQLVFLVLLPLLVCLSYQLNIFESFHFKKPKTIHFLAATLIALSGLVLAREVSIFQRKFLFGDVSALEEFAKMLKPMLEDSSPLLLFFAFALTPGICEEFFFRGLLFSSFKKQQKPMLAIFWTAALFAIMHLNFSNFTFYLVMGILLGLIVHHTGSIFPAMFAHVLNNSLGLFGEPCFKTLGLWETFSQNDANMPIPITLICIAVLASGLWILKLSKKSFTQGVASI